MMEWILSSSMLIFIWLLLRALLKGRVSPRLQYALWLIVLLRLLLPVSPFRSSLSVMGLAESALERRSAVQRLPEPVAFPETEDCAAALEPAGTEQAGAGLPAAVRAGLPAASAPAGAAAQRGRISLMSAGLLYALWGLGAAAVLSASALTNRRLGRRLRQGARPLPGKWTVPPRRVYISPAPDAPCLFGFFAPAIFVPEAIALNDQALGHVLSHERAHYRQGDQLWSALRVLALVLHWYNPLVWWACLLSRRDAEAAADAAAIAALGEKERLDYSRTLIALVAESARPGDLLSRGTTMSGAKRTIRERVALIAKKPRTGPLSLVLVILVCAANLRLTYTGPGWEKSPDAGTSSAESAVEESGDIRAAASLLLSGEADILEGRLYTEDGSYIYQVQLHRPGYTDPQGASFPIYSCDMRFYHGFSGELLRESFFLLEHQPPADAALYGYASDLDGDGSEDLVLSFLGSGDWSRTVCALYEPEQSTFIIPEDFRAFRSLAFDPETRLFHTGFHSDDGQFIIYELYSVSRDGAAPVRRLVANRTKPEEERYSEYSIQRGRVTALTENGPAGAVEAELWRFALGPDAESSAAQAAPEPAPAGALSSEESFASSITKSLTGEGYTALTYADYAAEYSFPLQPPAGGPAEFKDLGLVFVKPNPGIPEQTIICQVLYSYELETAIRIGRADRPGGAPNPGFFTYSDRDLAGRLFSETHPWANWYAGYQPPSDGYSSLYLYLLSARDLGEEYCRALLADIR